MSEQENIAIRQPEEPEFKMVQALRDVDRPTAEVPPVINRMNDTDFHKRTIHMAAFSEGTPVATVRLDTAHPDRDGYYFVREMRTHPEYRKRGIGGLVLAAAERVATEKGAILFGLDAPIETVPFYEQQGYKNTTIALKNDHGVEMLRMVKKARP